MNPGTPTRSGTCSLRCHKLKSASVPRSMSHLTMRTPCPSSTSSPNQSRPDSRDRSPRLVRVLGLENNEKQMARRAGLLVHINDLSRHGEPVTGLDRFDEFE